MLLREGKRKIDSISGTNFGELFKKSHSKIKCPNKGMVGQLIEKAIGLDNTNFLLDFEDGELKTNKCTIDKNNNTKPMETMFVKQVSTEIDNMVCKKPIDFINSSFFKKIENLLYVPVFKNTKNAQDWYVIDCYHVELKHNPEVLEQLMDDWNTICYGMRQSCSTVGKFGTTNGEYIQVRSKDSKPYHPIVSSEFGEVTNKNYAIYFRPDFMKDIISGVIKSNV